MKMRIRHVAAMAALAGMVIGGCVEERPVASTPIGYTAPPTQTGPDNAPPGVPPPGSVPPPGAVQEPPPGAAVAASVPPPAPPTEVAPPAPAPNYVWTPGYYNWNGVAWVWAPGAWIVPP